MEDEVINELANEIIEKLKGKIYKIEEYMTGFLQSQISQENKAKALEQLYIFQLYSDAYVSPDPRVKMRLFVDAELVLTAENDEEVLKKIEILKTTTETMKYNETHPLVTTKRKLEDREKFKNVIW